MTAEGIERLQYRYDQCEQEHEEQFVIGKAIHEIAAYANYTNVY